jgi:hypothetical protein
MAAGCGSQPIQDGWQTCVDRNTNVSVDQRYCDTETRTGGWGTSYFPHYHWYYYPRGFYTSAPPLGSPVPPGGTYAAAPFDSVRMAHGSFKGSTLSHGSSASRGGFGSSAHAGSGS